MAAVFHGMPLCVSIMYMSLFVLHEHHSKRLHYDLRLEIDGVLKSWAVPKGPSLSPREKRLAILVNDHPLEYASFEGIIPEGIYGAGPVVISDSGECDVQSADFSRGRVEFILNGKIFKGGFVLTRLKGKDKEWLLIKVKDENAVSPFVLKPALTKEKLSSLPVRMPPCETE